MPGQPFDIGDSQERLLDLASFLPDPDALLLADSGSALPVSFCSSLSRARLLRMVWEVVSMPPSQRSVT